MSISSLYLFTIDQENFVVNKVTWDKKSSMHFNFTKEESTVCTYEYKELRY